jgi:extracellular elastinolytic metalloproteinase
VGYVSSSLTRDSALVGSLQLSQAEGWARAAKSAKLARSIANILTRKRVGRWTQLGVAGLDTPQRVRTVAFPTVGDGVVPAYESIVQDTKRAKGYRAIVDARNGRVLLRHTIVHNVAAGFRHAAVTVTPFNGTLPAVDGGCGPNHPITVPAGIRAFSGFANATNPLTDITLDLFRVGPPDVQILHADTVFTPERFRYEPAGGVPPGDYYVRVCEFANNDGPPPEPRTYDGTLTLDDTPAPPPYWARWATTPSSFPLNLEQDPWHRPATDTRETWCWRSAPGCDRVIGNLASRAPWDHNMKTDQPTFTTVGNNAITAESWTNENVPAPFQFRPTSPTRDYVFPWTDSWNQSDCNASLGFTPGVSWDVSASVVALFVAHNRVHDWAYHLGLTEENWNAQDHNFGRTEQWRQNDAVLGDAQSGAAIPTQQAFALGARNNANMSTVPEGGSSVTNMYFWQPQAGSFYGPCADGDFDTGVIVHEYGHLIENRLIGKGGLRAPFPFHTSPMGEGHADLFAIEYLNAYNFFPSNGENRFARLVRHREQAAGDP